MAEVLGAVTSVIALLDIAAKGAVFLRGIPEIQHEYRDLCFQIDLLKGAATVAQNIIKSPSPTVEKQIENVAGQINSILDELYKLQGSIHKQSADNVLRAKKHKWVIKQGQVVTLLGRAQRAQDNLTHVLQWYVAEEAGQSSQYRERMREPPAVPMLPSYESLNHASSWAIEGTRQPDTESFAEEEDFDIIDEDGSVFDEKSLSSDEKYSVISYNQPSNSVATLPLDALGAKPRCANGCTCRCHTRPQTTESPGWMGSIIGSWGMEYYSRTVTGMPHRNCVCQGDTSLRMEYKPPQWLWPKVWLLQAGYGDAGIRFALRPARVLPPHHSLWGQVTGPSLKLKFLINSGLQLYPDDQGPQGMSLIEKVILTKNYAVLQLLLDSWATMLPKRGFSKRVSYAINWRMDRDKPDDLQLQLLQKAASYVEDQLEFETTLVHAAAQRGTGMEEALRSEAWAVNEFDRVGRTPLVCASIEGHAEAVQQLIDAGANVNMEAAQATPLAAAAGHNNIDCMRRLIHAKCRIDQQDDNGDTALHLAAASSSAEAIRLLLREGASAESRCLRGRTPLHKMAYAQEDAHVVDEAVQLLLDARPALEAKDDLGRTPVMSAAMNNNLTVLRRLAEVGASFTSVTLGRENILHMAARHCTAETIRFLSSLALSAMNTTLKDTSFSTSWEVFRYRLVRGTPPGRDYELAFIELYQGIRDRRIRQEVTAFRHALDSLSANKPAEAAGYLFALAKSEADAGNQQRAGFHSGIAKNIQGGHGNAAEAVEEELQELEATLASPAWDQPITDPYLKFLIDMYGKSWDDTIAMIRKGPHSIVNESTKADEGDENEDQDGDERKEDRDQEEEAK